jgi:predicted dehydrogenase
LSYLLIAINMRIGVLGAARIVSRSLIHPARKLPGVTVSAIAARNLGRAKHFARRYGIPTSYGSYAELIADPTIDAIYIPLPNSLHGYWSLQALQAGKDVLCEKPLAANANEAALLAEAATSSGKLLMEAFHQDYHPLAQRIREIISQGLLGQLNHIETYMCIPMLRPGDIRYSYNLGGGATMDTGCYAIHMARRLAGAEPVVINATAQTLTSQVDRSMEALLQFPNGISARVVCSLLGRRLLNISAHVYGKEGELHVINPVLPHYYNRLQLRTASGTVTERVSGLKTYDYQLQAFVNAVRNRTGVATGPEDALQNMRVIDSIYRAAGLPLRQPMMP